jgi:hypothetical protein
MSRKYEEGPTYEFSCLKKHETENAVLLIDPATGEEFWIPLSQISEMHFKHREDGYPAGTVVMTEWIAKKRGLV